LSNRLPATHDLHIRLEKALREHKIVIPFPQRDIHIRSVATEFGTIDKIAEANLTNLNRG